MFKRIKTLFIAFLVLSLSTLGYLLVGPGGVYTSVDRGEDKVIIVEKGTGMEALAQQVVDQGLVSNKIVFYMAAFLGKQWGKLKAGEFLIPEHAGPMDIIKILCCGRVIVHSVTIPEGLTVSEIIEKIDEIPQLKGQIEHIPSEGFMLPETYTFVYGDTKQSLINRMEASMVSLLSECWEKKADNLPIKSPLDALILASIIEKESGRKNERQRISAVFQNRLKKGMKLQADPTVIYGITLGKTRLGRSITKEDLKSETVYNTYIIDGLPPRPIACPGKAAIQAAVNPLKCDDLFFVANGAGGHNFSRLLSQHNAYVGVWKQCRR